MIDLHCHFLPGIDDGAQTLEEGLALARAAVAAGISTAVLTPHVHPGRWDNSCASIAPVHARFAQALAEHGIPLALRAAGEVRICPEIISMAGDDALPYLGRLDGYRILLLEFPHSHILVGADKLVRWLLARHIRPMIAHPERNKEIMRDVDKLYPYVAMGCMLQVTAASLVGEFGPASEKAAHALLERGWVDVVATDSHNMAHRPPMLDRARDFLAGWGGEALARRLTLERPAAIIGVPA